MRVLLSAYACEPNRGGEAEVGWQRMLQMRAFADEVWTLTRANNQSVIEADPVSMDPKLHFLYYDLPPWAQRLKKRRLFLHVYFILWQWGAYRTAQKQHRKTPFDCVYHVTFASMLAVSFMGKLGIPFVIGPIAGGERAPHRLRRSMPFRGKTTELLRDVAMVLQRYNPLARSAYAAADRIYVASPDSMKLVPRKWHAKTNVQLAIAIEFPKEMRAKCARSGNSRFVFIGRLLPLKGVHFAVRALAQIRQRIPDATLAIIGGGPYEKWLRGVVDRCGVTNSVEFIGTLPRNQILNTLHQYTALIFPSLRDSGGMVVLEALSCGVPVVCLDLGGPGVLVNESCGIVVPTIGVTERQIEKAIGEAMVRLASLSDAERANLSQGAVARAAQWSWEKLTATVAGGMCRREIRCEEAKLSK
jgi:glycosyltransferase involved in cell wall biosynthesis